MLEKDMSIFKKGQKLENQFQDGIWLDYKNYHWLFFMKDAIWDKEEIRNIEKNNITISFIQKGIIDAFLLEIYDCLETSDMPFCMKDAEGELLDSLQDKREYTFEIVILNEKNEVVTDREIPFLNGQSKQLKDALKIRIDQDFTSENFDQAYNKLLQQYEPFELEKFNVFVNKK